MEGLTNFEIKENVETLELQREEEIRKNINTFILNPNLNMINKKISEYQAHCNHEEIKNGKCIYCHKQVEGGV